MKYWWYFAAFLGALGIGLFWLSGFIEEIKETSYSTGKAECEAEQAKKRAVTLEKESEVQNVLVGKAVVVWGRPNSRLPALIKRMRKEGIGTSGNYSADRGLSAGRE